VTPPDEQLLEEPEPQLVEISGYLATFREALQGRG
jgi:hypothetical protein